jgi:hypothetical protein
MLKRAEGWTVVIKMKPTTPNPCNIYGERFNSYQKNLIWQSWGPRDKNDHYFESQPVGGGTPGGVGLITLFYSPYKPTDT